MARSNLHLRNLVLPPGILLLSFWLGAVLTSSLCRPAAGVIQEMANHVQDRWGLTVAFGELSLGGKRGLLARRIRFSKRTRQLLLSGGCDSLWISPFQRRGDTIRIVCQSPRFRLLPLDAPPEGASNSSSGVSPPPADWERLPGVNIVLKDGCVVWEDEPARSLRDLDGTFRFTQEGKATLDLSGACEGMGDNRISLRVDRRPDERVSAELRIEGVGLDPDSLGLDGVWPDFRGTLSARILCRSDDLETFDVEGRMEGDAFAPDLLSLASFSSAFEGSFSQASRRLVIDEIHASLPDVLELDGGRAVVSERDGLKGSLKRLWVSGELLDRIALLDQVEQVEGTVELADVEVAVDPNAGLRCEGGGRFRIHDVGFAAYSDKLAAGHTFGRGRFSFSGDSEGILVEAEGDYAVGGMWLEDVEWSRLKARGSIQARLPSGLVSTRDLRIQTDTGADIAMRDSWLDLRSGRMTLNLEAPALRMDHLIALTPARTRASLSSMSLTGQARIMARIAGYPAADRLGPSQGGLGAIRAEIDATLLSAGMEQGGLGLEIGDSLRASLEVTARKSQTECSVRFEGKDISHTFSGEEAHHDSVRGEAAFLIDAPLGRVRVTSARVSFGDEVQLVGGGEFSEYDMSLRVRGLEAPLAKWRGHLPEAVGLFPEMRKARLGFEIETRGPMAQAISGEAVLSDVEYLFAQDPSNAVRMDRVRLLFSPMGMARWASRTMETSFDAAASNVVVFQEGRVLFEANRMTGAGRLTIDQGKGRIRLEDSLWRAEGRMSLSMAGELERAREGYEGRFDLSLPAFQASFLGELIPGFQPMDLEGILEAQGRLTLGEGTHFHSLQGVVRTRAPLDFHLSSTVFEGMEGELPFVHSFVGESAAPRLGELRAERITYDRTYIMENPLATGYYLDGTLVADQSRFLFAKGDVAGRGSVGVFDDVPFDFSVRLNEANIAELVEQVKPLMGSIFLGPIDGHLEGAGVKDRFHMLEGRLESRGGWLSARQFQERIVPLVPLRPLEEILKDLVGLLKNMRLEVDIYEEEGLPRYRYRIIDPMGLVKEKGESLITMPIDVLTAFIKKPEK